MNGTLTEDQKNLAISKAFIVADAVKDAGEAGISSGYLFSIVQDCIPEDDFDTILLYLKRENLITVEGNSYFWVQREYCTKLSKMISDEECDACYSSDPKSQFVLWETCKSTYILKEIG